MANRLQDTTNNVVKLGATRKAKGAKSSGGAPRKPRLVTPAHEEKPKIREPKPVAVTGSSAPSDAEQRAHQQDKLVALHTKHRAVDNRMDVVKAALQEINLEKKQIRAAIENAGFPLKLYDEAYDELKLKTKRVDLEAKEKIRGLIREALGLPAGPQASLLDKLPDAGKAAVHWANIGFRDCINGEAADPVKAGCPPENTQDYLTGHGDASAVHARGIKQLAEEPVKPSAEPLITAEAPLTGDFWTLWPESLDEWTEGQRAAFTGWFNQLDPNVDVDIAHVGALAMFDELVLAEANGATNEELAEAVESEF